MLKKLNNEQQILQQLSNHNKEAKVMNINGEVEQGQKINPQIDMIVFEQKINNREAIEKQVFQYEYSNEENVVNLSSKKLMLQGLINLIKDKKNEIKIIDIQFVIKQLSLLLKIDLSMLDVVQLIKKTCQFINTINKIKIDQLIIVLKQYAKYLGRFHSYKNIQLVKQIAKQFQTNPFINLQLKNGCNILQSIRPFIEQNVSIIALLTHYLLAGCKKQLKNKTSWQQINLKLQQQISNIQLQDSIKNEDILKLDNNQIQKAIIQVKSQIIKDLYISQKNQQKVITKLFIQNAIKSKCRIQFKDYTNPLLMVGVKQITGLMKQIQLDVNIEQLKDADIQIFEHIIQQISKLQQQKQMINIKYWLFFKDNRQMLLFLSQVMNDLRQNNIEIADVNYQQNKQFPYVTININQQIRAILIIADQSKIIAVLFSILRDRSSLSPLSILYLLNYNLCQTLKKQLKLQNIKKLNTKTAFEQQLLQQFKQYKQQQQTCPKQIQQLVRLYFNLKLQSNQSYSVLDKQQQILSQYIFVSNIHGSNSKYCKLLKQSALKSQNKSNFMTQIVIEQALKKYNNQKYQQSLKILQNILANHNNIDNINYYRIYKAMSIIQSKKHDYNKAHQYINICYQYAQQNYECNLLKGQLYVEQGCHTKALKIFQQTLQSLPQSNYNNFEKQTNILIQIGKILMILNLNIQASKHFNLALSLFNKYSSQLPIQYAKTKFILYEIYKKIQKKQSAIVYLQDCVNLLWSKALNDLLFESISKLIQQKIASNDFQEGQQLIQKMLLKIDKQNNQIIKKQMFKYLAIIKHKDQLFSQSLKYYIKCMEIIEKTKTYQYAEFQNILNKIIELCRILKDYRGQRIYQNKIQILIKNNKNNKNNKKQTNHLNSYKNIALKNYERGNYNTALQYYRKGLVIVKELNKIQEQVQLMKYIGQILFIQQNYVESRQIYNEVLLIIRKDQKMKLQELQILYFIGLIQENVSQQVKSKYFYQKAIQLGQRYNLKFYYFGLCNYRLGILFNKNQQLHLSLSHLKKALFLLQNLQSSQVEQIKKLIIIIQNKLK